ncbi:unnamed protein product, partial [Ostreobium quekettii]
YNIGQRDGPEGVIIIPRHLHKAADGNDVVAGLYNGTCLEGHMRSSMPFYSTALLNAWLENEVK